MTVLQAGTTGRITAVATVTGTPSLTENTGFGGQATSGIRFTATLERVTRGQSEETTAAPVLVFVDARPTVASGPPWYLAWAGSLRHGFAEASRALPGDGGRLTPGLALGNESLVTESLDAGIFVFLRLSALRS